MTSPACTASDTLASACPPFQACKISSFDSVEKSPRSLSSSQIAGLVSAGAGGEGVGDGTFPGGEPGEDFKGLLIGGEPFAVGGGGEHVPGLGQALAFLDQHGKGGLVALHLLEGVSRICARSTAIVAAKASSPNRVGGSTPRRATAS